MGVCEACEHMGLGALASRKAAGWVAGVELVARLTQCLGQSHLLPIPCCLFLSQL